ncbi:MAG: glycoside hydrolase family 6 protein [Burkholderiaceae bacterium]|nr:glycoside hydrolase family 6 protein [Microbacteriaceae bacterium]
MTMHASPRTTRPSRVAAVSLAVSALVVAAIVGAGAVVSIAPPADNPFAARSLYVSPDSAAATAAASSPGTAAFGLLASTPSAIWLLPEVYPIDDVDDAVHAVMTSASRQDALPVFVVYGLPDRDCGSLSAGGLSPDEYPRWIEAIAGGIAGRDAVVILEPDSLAQAPDCPDPASRISAVRTAASALTHTGTSIYLDGGHSDWRSPSAMAAVLERAGISGVRGFATNVSNYNPSDDERVYAEEVSALTGGAHFVIDSSRNGNGSDGSWCNPPGRAIGQLPSPIDDGTPEDATLWIKNPGESDGTCNGGPAAGGWWASRALDLVAG